MNKECRDKLFRIGITDHRLFLHNLLEKEEEAESTVSEIKFEYLSYKEGQKGMNKGEAIKVISILKTAKGIGEKAGKHKLLELMEGGDRWQVIDDATKKVVGGMLDLCGFAWLTIPGRGKIVSAFKKIATYDSRFEYYVADGMRISKSYKSGYSLSIISTGRQEMSVNEAAVEAASDFLNANGLENSWDSRID